MKFFLIISFICIILFPNLGWACTVPQSYSQTFLPTLPNEVLSQDIVARIMVADTMKTKEFRLSQVEVIHAIKGAVISDILIVQSALHSCAQDYDIKNGEEYFIAGALNQDDIFIGEWRGDVMLPSILKKIETTD